MVRRCSQMSPERWGLFTLTVMARPDDPRSSFPYRSVLQDKEPSPWIVSRLSLGLIVMTLTPS